MSRLIAGPKREWAVFTCGYAPEGRWANLCNRPATFHILWSFDTQQLGLTCDFHLPAAIECGFVDIHPCHATAACDLPGTLWVRAEPGVESRCELPIDDDDLAVLCAETVAA